MAPRTLRLRRELTRAERVHTGTFVRFHLGYAHFRADFSPYPPTGGASFGLSIGGTLIRGLALKGLMHFIADGDAEGVFMGQWGLGLVYYFLPYNFHVSAMVGSGSGFYDDPEEPDPDRQQVATGNSLALSAIVGYEFLPEQSQWGIGPAFQIWYAHFDEGDYVASALLMTFTNH